MLTEAIPRLKYIFRVVRMNNLSYAIKFQILRRYSHEKYYTYLKLVSCVSQLKQPEWHPDFGPAKFVPAWGATMVGVRPFLLAYNINILGTKEQAHR